MSSGSVQTILVCAPSSVEQAPCPSGQAVVLIQGYVLDASQQSMYEAVVSPFDYVLAAGIWAFSFTFVIGLFLVARSAGTILNLIRR